MQPNRTKSQPPEIPKSHVRGEDPFQPDWLGDSPKPLRGPQGNQESASAPFSEPWLIWSLGQPMQAASSSRQTDCRDVLNRGETMVKEEPKRRHPHSSPVTRDGAKGTQVPAAHEITL